MGNSSPPHHFFISARDYGDLSVMRRLPHPTMSRRCLFERGYHLEVPSRLPRIPSSLKSTLIRNLTPVCRNKRIPISPGFPPGQSRSTDLLDAPSLSFFRSLSFALLPPLQHARMDVCPGFGTLNGEFSLTALTHIPGGGRNKWARSLARFRASYGLKREPSAAAAAFRQQR